MTYSSTSLNTELWPTGHPADGVESTLRCAAAVSDLLSSRPLIGLLQQLLRLAEGVQSVIFRLQCQLVLLHRSVALGGNIEDLTQFDMAPDFSPPGKPVTL
jgi:hypothetical protein